MKHSMIILGLVVVCVMGGCRKEVVQPESAALALYERYAENDHGLTVAYLGDFRVENQLIDAVMLTAPDEQEWHWLCEEFGVRDLKSRPAKAMSHFIDSVRNLYGVPDTATSHTNVVYAQGNVNLLGDSAEAAAIMEQLNSADSGVRQAAADRISEKVVNMLGGRIGLPFPTGGTVVSRQVKVRVMKDSTRQLPDSLFVPQQVQLLNYAKNNGYQGSVVAANFDEMTLWLFFYRNKAEFDAIFKHINQEIIPFD